MERVGKKVRRLNGAAEAESTLLSQAKGGR